MVETRGEDEALLARVARGDRAALEQLYRRNASWITARLQSRCPDADVVDIAVQDTFLTVWKSAKKYRGDGVVGAWLWGIAIRKMIDQLRKNRPSPVDPATFLQQARTAVHGDSSEDAYLAAGLHGDVAQAMQRLEPDLQAVLVATAVDGLSTREAAALLGIPHGTVKTRAQRARRHLRESLA